MRGFVSDECLDVPFEPSPNYPAQNRTSVPSGLVSFPVSRRVLVSIETRIRRSFLRHDMFRIYPDRLCLQCTGFRHKPDS